MTKEEARQVFLDRGYIEVEGGTIYDADKWRESCRVISEWLEQEPTITSTNNSGEMIYPQVEGITPTVVNEDIYECSCGYGWDKNKTSRFHFCPNCGKAVGDGNDYKYIKSISNPTGIEFDIDIDKKVESYGKLLKHPVVKHIMDEEQEQLDFVQLHKRIPVTLTVSGDLISRQAVIDCYKKWQPYMATRLHEFEKELSELPSVAISSAEPKTVLYSGDGYADGYMVYDMAECPSCGRKFEYGDETWHCNFCPDCGQALKWESEDKE